MKALKIVALCLLMMSCSDDDKNCSGNKSEINKEYDRQVQWVMENTNPIDNRQIALINEERAKKLQNACD